MTVGPPAPSTAERTADWVIHAIGMGAGIPAAIAIVVLGATHSDGGQLAPLAVYAIGLLAMLACSAAYNLLPTSRRRDWLRRLDHAAIFAMIAGTYTPFTTFRLATAWSFGLTAAIWAVAALGMIAKLWRPRLIEPASVVLYLALGWIGLVALKPFMDSLETSTLWLLAGGGVIYSAGVIFHLWRNLPYQNAIWHGFVLAAAAVHYLAVLTTV